MKKQWNKWAMIALAATLTFGACKKKSETTPSIDAENTQSMEDNNYSENEFDNVADIVQDASDDAFQAKPAKGSDAVEQAPNLPQCATVTKEAWTPPGTANATGKKITIDFGTTGCTAGNRTYKGKIISYHTKGYSALSSYTKVTFEEFYVKRAGQDDSKYAKFEATKVVVNESAASTSNPNLPAGPYKHRVKVWAGGANAPADYSADSYATITFADGKTITWNTNRVRTWAEGYTTPFVRTDDVWTVAGTHKGKNRNNTTFQMQTIEGSPLQYKASCFAQGIFRPSSGKLQVSSSNHPTVVLDFGNGNCDNDFTVQ